MSDSSSYWSQQFDLGAYESVRDVAVDSGGNSYIAGNSNINWDFYFGPLFFKKYAPDGKELWSQRFHRSNYDFFSVWDIAVDSNDDVYVVGIIDTTPRASGGLDAYIVKFSPSGDRIWERRLGASNPSSSDWDSAHAVAVDANDNVYVTGETNGSLEGNPHAGSGDVYVAKYNSGGAKLWVKQLGSSDFEMPYGIAVDSKGAVYSAGYTQGKFDGHRNRGGRDMFLVKYGANGGKDWSRLLGSRDSDMANNVVVDSADNVYLLGNAGGSVARGVDTGGVMAKYQPDGTELWIRRTDVVADAAIDGNDNIFAVGNSSDPVEAGNPDGSGAFVAKYDSKATKLQVRQYSIDYQHKASGVDLGPDGSVYVSGDTEGALEGNRCAYLGDAYLVRFSPSFRSPKLESEPCVERSSQFGIPEEGNQAAVGDPINVATGNMYEYAEDLSLPGRGLPLQFARFYNSQDTYRGPLGSGWTHIYNTKLRENRDGTISQIDPQGAFISFISDANGIYRASNREDTIERLPEGGFKLTKQNGIRWIFATDGRLRKIADTNNNAIAFFYTDGRLARIVDTVGKETRLDYDGQGRITALADPAKRTVKYAYDGANNLVSVTDPLGQTTSYAYDAKHNITKITKPSGGNVYFTYDADDRAVSSYADDNVYKTGLAYYPNRRYTRVTDSKGNTSIFNYNANGQVTRIADPSGKEIRYAWDARGNKVASTDQLGNTTRMAYDAAGNLTRITDPTGAIVRMAYESGFNRLAKVTDPDGNVTSYSYDGRGNLTRSIDVLGGQTAFAYDAHGQLVRATDAMGQESSFVYDDHGNITATLDASGNKTRFAYDNLGRMTSRTDALGRTTRFEYDLLDRPTKTINSDGTTVQISYDTTGNPTKVTDENGNTTTARYNVHNQLLSVTDALGNITSYAYDTEGNLVSETDPEGNETTYEYDALTRLTKVVRPDETSVVYGYDATGNRTRVTDPNGNVTKLRYDPLRRLTGVTDAAGGVTGYEYDWAGRMTKAANPNGHATTFAYDALGRLIKKTDPLGNVTTFTYDAIGNLAGQTDANGKETRYAYDFLSRLTSIAYPDGSKVENRWDAVGNLIKVSDATGVVAYSYDDRDRLTEESLPGGRVLRHGYDAAGNRTALLDPSGGKILYGYDAANRLTFVTDPESNKVSYAYDARGLPTEVSYPTRRTGIIYTYDDLGRIARITNKGIKKNRILSRFTYAYDNNGNPLTITDKDRETSTYAYDALDRLTSEAYPDSRTLSYTYDAAGNRTSMTDGANRTEYTYDAAERVLKAGATAYAYDDNGNLISRKNGQETTSYAYDFEDRLTKAGQMSYAYDAADRLVSAAGPDGSTTYTHDGGQVLREKSGDVITSYTRGLDQQLISRKQGAEAPLYYQFDAVGNVVGLSDAGAPRASYSYDTFGNFRERQDDGNNPFTYAGNAYEPATGLYNFHARWYDPQAGRFLSKDPVAGLTVLPQTLNPYPYGVNNPLVYTDPSGEFAPLLLAAPVAAYLAKNALQSAVFSGAEYYLTSRGEKGGFDSVEFARVVGGDTLTGSINPFAGVGKAGKIAKVVGKGGFNPFKGKTPQQIDDMFRKKGFSQRGPDPVGGEGGYVNPTTGRSYHIDEANKYGEPPHVDVNRLKPFKKKMDKRKFPMWENE